METEHMVLISSEFSGLVLRCACGWMVPCGKQRSLISLIAMQTDHYEGRDADDE